MSEDAKGTGPELPTCAAIRIGASGMLVAGKRHDECYRHLAEHGIKHFPATQGFMTNQGKMKLLERLALVLMVGVLMCAGTLAAQTEINPLTQLKSSTPGATGGTLVVVLTNGRLAIVNLGPCFTVSVATPPVLTFNPGVAGCAPATAAVPSFADLEVPGGTPNGTLATFTLAHADAATGNSLQLFKNGQLLQGGGVDYTLSGATITFIAAAIPLATDALLASYRY